MRERRGAGAREQPAPRGRPYGHLARACRPAWQRRVCGAALALAGAGCARPDDVRVVPSPAPGLSVRVETFYGGCAVCSDNTNVYAVYARDGREARALVLSGEYLQGAGFRWDGARHLVICLKDGYTGEFHNEVTLAAGGGTPLQLHSSLIDGCEATSYAEPAGAAARGGRPAEGSAPAI